jgi:hypothetical protein
MKYDDDYVPSRRDKVLAVVLFALLVGAVLLDYLWR